MGHRLYIFVGQQVARFGQFMIMNRSESEPPSQAWITDPPPQPTEPNLTNCPLLRLNNLCPTLRKSIKFVEAALLTGYGWFPQYRLR
jgi:hypothetical protein